jgi:hypothetical protein
MNRQPPTTLLRPRIEPYVNPPLLEWEDVQKIAALHKEAWGNPKFILLAQNTVHVAYRDRLKNDHFLIAISVCPKMKGWPWYKKTGLPVNFGDPGNTDAMLMWAKDQAFWEGKATKKWAGDNDVRWYDVFLNVCLDLSEGRIEREAYSSTLAKLIADAIRAFYVNPARAEADKG